MRKSVRLWTVGVLLVVVVETVTVIAVRSSSPSAFPNAIICNGSQIKVTIGTTYKTANMISTPVTLTNTGATCRLVRNGPSVSAVRGPNKTTVGFPALGFRASNTRVSLTTRQSVQATIEVLTTNGRNFSGCKPEKATGVIVQGYGNPLDSQAYFPLRLKGVCSGGNAPNLWVIGYE